MLLELEELVPDAYLHPWPSIHDRRKLLPIQRLGGSPSIQPVAPDPLHFPEVVLQASRVVADGVVARWLPNPGFGRPSKTDIPCSTSILMNLRHGLGPRRPLLASHLLISAQQTWPLGISTPEA